MAAAELHVTWRKRMLEYLLRIGTAAPARPAALFAALLEGDPRLTDFATEECGGTGYARTAIVFADAATGTNPTDDAVIANTGEVDFGTGNPDWGTITHFAVCEGDTEGADDWIWVDALAESKVISSDPVTLPIGDAIASLLGTTA